MTTPAPSKKFVWREALLLAVVTVLFVLPPLLVLESLQPETGEEPSSEGLENPPPSWLLALDDAYIFVRYAQQAARGEAFQWNSGESSTGASSFLFPWLLVPGQWLADDLPGWSWWSRGVGIVTLWLAGLAACGLLRRVGSERPWPLVGGAALILSGPIGFAALAGMESALNAAALLWTVRLWLEASDHPIPRRQIALAVALGLLPLVRPENAFVVGVAALTAMLRRPADHPLPRFLGAATLLPGLGLAALHIALTGSAAPAGAIAKSRLETPFLTPFARIGQYLLDFWGDLLPIYLGAHPKLLWPPVGLLALGTVGLVGWTLWRASPSDSRNPLCRLAPLAAVWLVLLAVAPLSSHLTWQLARHHHGAVACVWVLAVAGLARLGDLGKERIRPGLAWLLPLLLLLSLPFWSVEHARVALALHERNGLLAEVLEEQRAERLVRGLAPQVLLLNDAGLLALAHDGPMVDALGPGTPDLTRAAVHGPGAQVEALARRNPVPQMAAVNLNLVSLPALLGEPVTPVYEPVSGTEFRRLQRELLRSTPLAGFGLDFAYLPHEERFLRWRETPDPNNPSHARLLPAPGGLSEYHGCRALYGVAAMLLPRGVNAGRLRAAALHSGAETAVVVRGGDATAPIGPTLADLSLSAEGWNEGIFEIAYGVERLWFERRGPGVPCLESVELAGGGL